MRRASSTQGRKGARAQGGATSAGRRLLVLATRAFGKSFASGENRFTYTARGLGERGSGRDTQAEGRVSAATAERARAVVRRAYPFAEVITVAPLLPA